MEKSITVEAIKNHRNALLEHHLSNDLVTTDELNHKRLVVAELEDDIRGALNLGTTFSQMADLWQPQGLEISSDMLRELYFEYRIEEVRSWVISKLQHYIGEDCRHQNGQTQEHHQVSSDRIHKLDGRLDQLDQENKAIKLKLKQLEAAQPRPVAANSVSATPATKQPAPAGENVIRAPTEEELIDLLSNHVDGHAAPDRPLPGEPGYMKK